MTHIKRCARIMVVALTGFLAAPSVALAQSDAGPTIVALDAAPAAVAPDSTPGEALPDIDPVKQGATIYSRIRSGEWLPALAAVMVLLVWAVRRFGGFLSKLAGVRDIFATQIAGYFIGYGLTFLTVWASAVDAGQPMTWGLISMSIGVAWAASGGWEKFSDVVAAIRKRFG